MKRILFTLCLSLLTIISFAQKKNKYAKDIKISVDKFDGTTTWNSPYASKIYGQITSERVSFTKIKEDEGIATYLSLEASGSTLNISKKGVIILFTDGEKIEFPNAKIETEAGGSGSGGRWGYSAFVRISDEELDKFITKDIDAFRLYIYDSNVTPYPEKVKKKRKQIRGWAQAIKEAN